ncbi:MAG: glycosyltransferase [Acidimicrobiia bacterium]|nr:glycosyltransferase [Acidimicrobiia bacterium]
MRVLQVHTRYREAGGEDAVIAAESKLLEEAGHEVVQWIGQNPSSTTEALKALVKAPHNKTAARAVAEAAVAAAPDVVHVHNTWFATSPAAFPALRAAVDVPIVMTLHNYRLSCANALLLRDGSPCELCVGASPWSAVRYGCYRDSRLQSVAAAATISINRRRASWTDNVDRFLALTEFAKTKAVAGGLPATKVEVKANFVPDPGMRSTSAHDSDQVLFVGRVTPEKGIGTLLEAWGQGHPDGLELAVAGDGPMYEELSNRSWPDVRFLGRVDRAGVQQLMSESRALVFPSEWYEGMPMTLLEAFASGLPVLGSNLGSMTEMLTPFGNSWLVQPGVVGAWSAAFEVLENDAAVSAASVTARALWESEYGPAKALDNLLAAYRA